VPGRTNQEGNIMKSRVVLAVLTGRQNSASAHSVPGRTNQEGNIMKSRVVLAVLAVMGILALTATAAQAGPGGKPFPIQSFFVCQGISGEDPGKRVDVDGSVLLVNPQNARLGNGTLACAVAKLFPAGSVHVPCPGPGCNEIIPNPGGLNSDGLKCYGVSVARQAAGLPLRWDINDFLFPGGTELNVPASSFQYVCSPATFTNPH